MITVRQIERLWMGRGYERLLVELLAARPEAGVGTQWASHPAIAAAAMAMIRLEELNQAFAPLNGALLRTILAAQDADGGWGDPMTTALCLRALCTSNGNGLAVDRGMGFLADLQQPQGIWPRIPIRRAAADALVSAFVLFQLGDNAQFRARVRFADAVDWFEGHAASLDDICRALWDRTRLRTMLYGFHRRAEKVVSWS